MKNIGLSLVVLAIFALSACNQEEIKQMQTDNAQLEVELQKRDSMINDYFASLNQIEENLSEIKSRQNIISKESQGVETPEREDKINEDLRMINELMEKNKQTIASLNKSLKNSNLRIEEMDKMIERLTKEIEQRDIEIGVLKDELAKLNIKVEELTSSINLLAEESRVKSEVIEQKTEEINAAWYVYGTRKELREQNIITREGGFIGIGKTDKVKADFNQEYFTRLDVSKVKTLQITGKNPRMVTTHPTDSYEITYSGTENLNNLVIKDPKKFWSASKYLVVMID